MRTISKKLSFWLVGYYDEFLKSRAVMDDDNSTRSTGTYDHSNSHHGNPMNSEAFLNPRYRYSYVERTAGSSGANQASADIYSTRYLHNQGLGNFLQQDTMRLPNSLWAGKAQPHFPSTLVANRQKYNGSGSDAYLKFSNGNDTAKRYTVPVGDTDSTMGRGGAAMGYDYSTGAPDTAANAAFLNSAHLTGVWSMLSQSVGGTIANFSSEDNIVSTSKPSAIYRQIKSPSGMPFLHIKSYFLHNTSAKNIIHYDGSLNFTGTAQEYFHMRLTTFHHNVAEYNQYGYVDNSSGHWQGTGTGKGSGGKSPIYTLKVGFAASDSPSQTGFTGSAAIEWRWSPHMRYHPTSGANTAHHKSYGVGTDAGTAWKIDPIEKDFKNTSASETSESTTTSLANDDFWHDFDFRIDWANEEYRVYVDGVEVTTNSMNTGNTTAPYSFATSRTSADATGWELELVPATESGSQTVAGANDETTYYHTLIDRVATYIDLSNPLHLTDTLKVAAEKFSIKMPASGISTAALTLGDDDNQLGLEDFLLTDAAWDWKMLVFRDDVNRPVWQGQLLDASLDQKQFGSKQLEIKASDSLYRLSRTLPIWDIGQEGLTAKSGDEYRLDEQQQLLNSLYFGANKMLISEPEIYGNTAQSYKVLTNQRMRLNSAHPIQMYNLEDDFGPNKVYRDWEDYPFAGMATSPNSASDSVRVYFPVASAGSHPLWTASNGTTVDFENTGISALDSGNWQTVQANRGSYTHPNGDFIYDFVEAKRTGGSQPALDDINIYSHHLVWNAGYSGTEGRGLLMMWLDGYVNTNSNMNIRRGDYMALTDTSDGVWDSNADGTNDAAFSYTGVWKVLHVEEQLVFGGAKTKVILDCPFKGYAGGAGGTAFLAGSGSYTPGTYLTTTTLKMNMVQGNVDYTSTDTVKHSRAHARWMQDLPLSTWFKKTFGIIDKYPLFGYGWDNTTSSSAALLKMRNGYMASALTVSASPPTNHTLTLGSASATTTTQNASSALKWLYDTYGNLVVEFHDSNENLLGSSIITNVAWSGVGNATEQTAQGWLGGAGPDVNAADASSGDDFGDVDLIKAAFGYRHGELYKFEDSVVGSGGQPGPANYEELWDGRVILRVNHDTIANMKTGYSIELGGFDSELDCTGIDGGWILERVSATMNSGTNRLGQEYALSGINWAPGFMNPEGSWDYFGCSSWNGTNSWGLASSTKHKVWRGIGFLTDYGNDYQNMYFLVKPGERTHLTWAELGFDTAETNTANPAFCPPAPNTETDHSDVTPDIAGTWLKHGDVVVTMPSKFGPNRTIPAGSYLKVRNISSDFKHCWVLWSDMRNDGTADADGGTRKSEFGLLLPTTENYSLDLSFTDQIVEGSRDSWLNIKAGQDCDIWNVSALTEPVTGSTWAAQTGGSNSEGNALYHNWENKAGSFIVIDMSKFLNMNTESSGGQIGLSSGGKKDMGDYITTSAGKSMLCDNYWKQAAANFIMPGTKSQFTMNENYQYWNQATTLVTQSIRIGDTGIFVEDVSEFPYQGFGPLKAYMGDEIEEEHYISWFGKETGTGPNGEDALLNVYSISKEDLIQAAQTYTNSQSTSGLPVASWRQFREYYLSLKSLDSAATASTSQHLKMNSGFLMTQDPLSQEQAFDSVQIGSTLSERYPLRLMLNMDGFAKSTNSNTYYLSDQMRFLASMALTDNWMQTYGLNCFWDIGSVPMTQNFIVQPEKGMADTTSTLDDYGGVSDNRNSDVLSLVKKIQELTKVGDTNGSALRFNYLAGKDGKLDMRPTFNSGIILNTTNTKLSKHKYSNKANFTNVRVYYAGGGSFVDYPTPTTGTQPYRWKVIDMGDVMSSEEARKIAKSQYQAMGVSNHEISLEIIKDNSYGNEPFEGDDLMLERGRYGYIADCTQQTFGDGENWFGHHLGTTAKASTLFPGMVSGMDGNLDGYNSTIASGNLSNDTGVHGNGVSDLYPVGTFSGNVRDAWDDSTVTGDTQRNDDASVVGTKVPWHQWFYWHGARSISQAVQVVNIPHNMPLVSATTGEELRISIMLKPGQTGGASAIGTAQFYVVLTDCAKDSTWKNHEPTNTTNENGYTKALINGNGFVQIKVPSAYVNGVSGFDANSLITLSVNYDYLVDLLRFRTHNDDGDTNRLRNAHETDWLNGITDNGTYNPNSIFPLGARIYSQFGNLGGFYTMSFAPRLHIVKDFAFTPASTVKYQDANAGYDSQTSLSIKNISWSITNRKTEKVSLILDPDETRYSEDFYGWLAPKLPEKVTIEWPEHGQDDRGDSGGEIQQEGDGSKDYQDESDTQYDYDRDSTEADVYDTATAGGESFTTSSGPSGSKNRMQIDGGISADTGDIFGASKRRSVRSESVTIDGLSFGIKTSGRAVDTPNGIVFPGAGSSDKMVGEHEMLINLPESNMYSGITIEAIVSLPVNTATNRAVLYADLESTTTNMTASSTSTIAQHKIQTVLSEGALPYSDGTDINPSTSRKHGGAVLRKSVTLFSKVNMSGTQEAGSALRLKLYRSAGEGDDNATHTALTVHSIKVRYKKVLGRELSQASSFSI